MRVSVVALGHQHVWTWVYNSTDTAFGLYRCRCGIRKTGHPLLRRGVST